MAWREIQNVPVNSLEQRARTSSMTSTGTSGTRRGTFQLFSINNPFQQRFNFRLRRLQKFTKYEIVVQVTSSSSSSSTILIFFCFQAVNAHGEGPLSDIVVGQTTESGEQSQLQNNQIRDLGIKFDQWVRWANIQAIVKRVTVRRQECPLRESFTDQKSNRIWLLFFVSARGSPWARWVSTSLPLIASS